MSTMIFELVAAMALLAVALAILETNARGLLSYLRSSHNLPTEAADIRPASRGR